MSTDCPTLNLAYDVKNHGFFRTMGVPEYCLSADTVTTQDILQAMRGIAAQRDDLRRHLAERRRDLTPVMSRTLRHVGAIISGQR
jgi:polysaccharide pyruvyl transferase WcaK-like protein